MNEYIQALERVAKISAQIYKVTSLAFAHTKQIYCPHGNCPSYPTHAWWCDKCWFELKEALDELESFQQGLYSTSETLFDQEPKMLPVKVSKYCEGVNGSMNCFEIGDKAVIKNATNPENNGLVVVIDSELMKHKDMPFPSLVYEVIFSNGYGRVAVDAHKLFPVLDVGVI